MIHYVYLHLYVWFLSKHGWAICIFYDFCIYVIFINQQGRSHLFCNPLNSWYLLLTGVAAAVRTPRDASREHYKGLAFQEGIARDSAAYCWWKNRLIQSPVSSRELPNCLWTGEGFLPSTNQQFWRFQLSPVSCCHHCSSPHCLWLPGWQCRHTYSSFFSLLQCWDLFNPRPPNQVRVTTFDALQVRGVGRCTIPLGPLGLFAAHFCALHLNIICMDDTEMNE